MSWQDVAAALVVIGAIAFLGSRFLGRGTKKASPKGPDVRANALVRKNRRPGQRA